MSADGESILITGGSGFIGSNLARSLIAEMHNVHLLLRPETNPWRLAGIEGPYTTHFGDLRDVSSLRRVVAICRPQVIYHVAAYGVSRLHKDRATMMATNYLGTLNLLEAVTNHEYRVLVQVGSSWEYGDKIGPMHEDDRLEPRGDYGVSKAAATLLCQAEARKGRPIVTVRVFSAYGPWEEPSRLVAYVMGCCHRGVAPQVTTGRQQRDFIFVEDVIALLRCASENEKALGHILHAGTGRPHAVRDMVETIVGVCGRGKIVPQFELQPPRLDEPKSSVASIRQTCAVTGWTPRYDLQAGIEHTWNWFDHAGYRQAA